MFYENQDEHLPLPLPSSWSLCDCDYHKNNPACDCETCYQQFCDLTEFYRAFLRFCPQACLQFYVPQTVLGLPAVF